MKKIFLKYFKITIRVNLFKDYYIFYTFSLTSIHTCISKKAVTKNITFKTDYKENINAYRSGVGLTWSAEIKWRSIRNNKEFIILNAIILIPL